MAPAKYENDWSDPGFVYGGYRKEAPCCNPARNGCYARCAHECIEVCSNDSIAELGLLNIIKTIHTLSLHVTGVRKNFLFGPPACQPDPPSMRSAVAVVDAPGYPHPYTSKQP